jgi:coenzyme F420-reducing hydrogenase beta subunit
MEEIISKNKCVGCTACANICPKNSISLIEDNKGFKYPIINQEQCINCGLCKKTCPVLNTKENNALNKCYAGYSKENKIREKTSSGGIFPVIANYVLKENGIVIGAAFDENNKLKHIAINKENELDKLIGSKYLQSDLKNIFAYIK